MARLVGTHQNTTHNERDDLRLDPTPTEISTYYQYDGAHLYDFLRQRDIRLPERVLNIGCAAGADSERLRALGAKYLVGIEPFAPAAQLARNQYDEVHRSTLQDWEYSKDPFDAVIMADSLEHMPDTHIALQKLDSLITSQALLVLSVPNIRHISVLYSLMLRGDWHYEPAGILDQTHLRFFTSKSMQRTLKQHNYDTVALGRWGAMGLTRRLCRLTPVLGEFLLSQMMFVARHRKSSS